MSKISLSLLAATRGSIHVHVEVEEGAAYGTSFEAAALVQNLSSFERHFEVSPAARRDRFGHNWTCARLMKTWKDAGRHDLDAGARSAFDTSFANGCIWIALNPPDDPDAARGKILARLRSGVPAHVRAVADGKGRLCCRILDGEPGDADDVEWIAGKRIVEPTPKLGISVSEGGWGGIPAVRLV